MPAKQALAIQARLRTFVHSEFDTIYELREVTGVSPSTAAAWFGKNAAVPDVLSLQPLTRRGLSLDWLFLGEGYPRRLPVTPDPAAQFEAMVRAHLPPAEPATRRRHASAVRLLQRYEGGTGGLARFGHSAVRVQFSALMESLRVYDELKRWTDEDDRRDELMEPLVAHLFEVARAGGYGDQLPPFDRQAEAAKRWERRRQRLRRIRQYLLDHTSKDAVDPSTRAFRQWLTEFEQIDAEVEADPIMAQPQAEGRTS